MSGPRWILNCPAIHPLLSCARQYIAIEFMPTTTNGNAQRCHPHTSSDARRAGLAVVGGGTGGNSTGSGSRVVRGSVRRVAIGGCLAEGARRGTFRKPRGAALVNGR